MKQQDLQFLVLIQENLVCFSLYYYGLIYETIKLTVFHLGNCNNYAFKLALCFVGFCDLLEAPTFISPAFKIQHKGT